MTIKLLHQVNYLRKCRVCGVEALSISDLSLFTNSTNGKYSKQNICKKCNNVRSSEYKKKNPDIWRKTNYKYLYGISLEEYEGLLQKQEYKCYGCSIHYDAQSFRLSVDHDHKTGRVRGLLCNECNRGLGKLKDDPYILRKLAAYIEKGGISEN